MQLNLAGAMHAAGIDVSIVAGQILGTIDDMIPADVPFLEIARTGPLMFPMGLVKAVHRHRPDVVFTTSNDVACLMLALRPWVPKSIRVIATHHLSLSGPRRRARKFKRLKLELLRVAMRFLLPKADALVAVSHGVADDIRRELSLQYVPIATIYNPIVHPGTEAQMHEPCPWPWQDRSLPTVIFVGRLSEEKRLDLLIQSFSDLIAHTPARLLVVGTGPDRRRLDRRIDELNLGHCCALPGFVHNPLPMIRNSDVLVLPSDYEGFGNVLVEAMACGTQLIATDCPFGPAEILREGEFGQLIPMNDVAALEAAMRRSLEGRFNVPPDKLRERAREFSLDAAARRYLSLL